MQQVVQHAQQHVNIIVEGVAETVEGIVVWIVQIVVWLALEWANKI
jgi:hypothetical protein